MEKDIAISIKSVKKEFYLPHHRADTLKQRVTQVFKKKDKGVDYYQALKEISFDVRQGEFVGIVGRNGAGKSTLLKIIAEIYRPTSGRVRVRGKLVPFIELGVGFNKELTGRENVYLNGALLGFSKKEVEAMYDSIVEFAELEPYMDQKLKNYSSGMKVRLAFSVAIKADADVLLLDEVLAVGDAAFQKKCYQYFDSLKDKKKTIIFVTHNMGAVRKYCDRAILIDDGKVAYSGNSDEIADMYMQLFNESSQSGEESRRGQVYLKNIGVKESASEIELSVVIKNKSNESFSDIRFGVMIRDQAGRVVAGFNNIDAKKMMKLSFAAHEEKELVFAMDNIFGYGYYTVDTTVLATTGVKTLIDDEEVEDYTIFDSQKGVAGFSVTRDNANYPIVLPVAISKKK